MSYTPLPNRHDIDLELASAKFLHWTPPNNAVRMKGIPMVEVNLLCRHPRLGPLAYFQAFFNHTKHGAYIIKPAKNTDLTSKRCRRTIQALALRFGRSIPHGEGLNITETLHYCPTEKFPVCPVTVFRINHRGKVVSKFVSYHWVG